MKFSEVMIYFDYNISKIADFLGVNRVTVWNWRKKNSIPMARQCQLELKTNGQLKADKE